MQAGTRLPATPVRGSVNRLADDLRRVSIAHDVVAEVAAEWTDRRFELPEWRAPVFPDENQPGVTRTDVFDFFFVGNSVNFAFRNFNDGEKFTSFYDNKKWHGAFGMWACLKRAYDAGTPVISGKFLSNLSRSRFDELFEPTDGTTLPLADRRHEILTGLGERLTASAAGDRFHELFRTESVTLYEDGDGFVDRLIERFPSFRDEWPVETAGGHTTVRFDKRAQLLAGMLAGHFRDDPWFSVTDPLSFTVFVDYNLPNVLRSLKVLQYDSELARRVDRGQPLEPGSRAEIEVRAATLLATDELAVKLSRTRDQPVTGPRLDYALFGARDGVDTKPHRCATTAY